MTTFVLVPGMLHGGWWFEPLADQLREHGHDAYPVTLTGLGDHADPAGASANLDTHIQDVVDVLESEQLTDVVLVGHSYGGMPITGAADRVPARVAGLVYVDAFVPEDGDSVWTLANDLWRQRYIAGSGATGLAVEPMNPALDPRTRPHPLASLVQRIRLTGAKDLVSRKDYLYLTEFEGTPFTPFHDRLREDPEWTVHTVASGHDVVRDAPDELLKILLAVAP
ncbi:alpha/beta hydrolase [Solihabitans fulvus]|uniref:Alpha/beta hydrolase n=1 Tax=Solihabitans fulvus TaxID=1892852 RepID=A0A5B2WW34_9PSEU|nr:alpha/beta fold hydrolase [Solihabitans fulvus]KAA2255941.1 alpha/beta hydrolase [Solihabitans fulvus]